MAGLNRWSGSAWTAPGKCYRWTGSAWQAAATIYRWTGSAWQAAAATSIVGDGDRASSTFNLSIQSINTPASYAWSTTAGSLSSTVAATTTLTGVASVSPATVTCILTFTGGGTITVDATCTNVS